MPEDKEKTPYNDAGLFIEQYCRRSMTIQMLTMRMNMMTNFDRVSKGLVRQWADAWNEYADLLCNVDASVAKEAGVKIIN